MISACNHTSYSKRSHLLYVDVEILRGAAVEWPRGAETGEPPPNGQKLVMIGGNIDLIDEEATAPLNEWVVERAYPAGIILHGLCATRNLFASNLPSIQRSPLGPQANNEQAVAVPRIQKCMVPAFIVSPPGITYRTCGEDRSPDVLAGIAPRTRTRYLEAWRPWGDCICARKASPWATRSSPDWDDALFDFALFEARIVGNAANTIRCKISSLRFWHRLV